MNIHELLVSIQQFDDIIDGVENAIASLPSEIANRNIESIVNDHSQVGPTTIFVALQGTTIDSHEFIADARKRGAACIIGEHSSSKGDAPDLVVGSTRALIGPLVSALYDFPSARMNLVGITGTNGKTTVSYLYSTIIRAHQKRCFTMGTTGVLLDGEKEFDSQTTPDPLVIQKIFADYLAEDIVDGALEVSSHALDQMRVLGTTFSAVGFTNFTQDHLDYHSTMEEYFQAKSRLFSDVYSPCAVVNIDDSRGEEIVLHAHKHGQKVVRVSRVDESADVFVKVKSVTVTGSQLAVHIRSSAGDSVYDLETSLIGDFNCENIAVALGLALAMGCDMNTAVRALRDPETVPGRLQRAHSDNNFSVFVDYAHTPDALERVLETMKPLARKLIVVFGCGGDRDPAKRPMMGRIAAELADVVIVTSDNPRSEDPAAIIDEIVKGTGARALVEVERRAAIKLALSKAQSGDAVIIAGKGHEQGQVFADHVQDFSDIDVVNELLTLEK